MIWDGEVPGEDRHAGRGVFKSPFEDAFEEAPQGAETIADGVSMERPAAVGRPLRQPRFVGFHVTPTDCGHASDGGVVARQELRKLTEHKVRVAHGPRPQTQGELGKVPLHRRREPWCDRSPRGSAFGCLVGGPAAWQLVGHRGVEQGGLESEQSGTQALAVASSKTDGCAGEHVSGVIEVGLVQFVWTNPMHSANQGQRCPLALE